MGGAVRHSEHGEAELGLTITMVKDLLPPPKPSPIANGDSKTSPTDISPQSRRWFGSIFVRRKNLTFEQRSKHNHRILICPIVLPHRAGDHTQFFEAKFFPETARDKIFRKHQVEDYATVAELLGVGQHRGTQQPAQSFIAPVGRHDETGGRI